MKISEVSKRLGLTQDTLRFYEEEKLIPEVKRDKNGYRNYTNYDLNCIYFVKWMREAGVSVGAIANYTRLFLEDRDGTTQVRKEILIAERQKIKKRLDKIQSTLDFLDRKIECYDTIQFQEYEDRLDPLIQQHIDERKEESIQ